MVAFCVQYTCATSDAPAAARAEKSSARCPAIAAEARKYRRRRGKIKGAARLPVRPKSREETPKEGNEVNELVTNLVTPN